MRTGSHLRVGNVKENQINMEEKWNWRVITDSGGEYALTSRVGVSHYFQTIWKRVFGQPTATRFRVFKLRKIELLFLYLKDDTLIIAFQLFHEFTHLLSKPWTGISNSRFTAKAYIYARLAFDPTAATRNSRSSEYFRSESGKNKFEKSIHHHRFAEWVNWLKAMVSELMKFAKSVHWKNMNIGLRLLWIHFCVSEILE